jgi:hypothetical protein
MNGKKIPNDFKKKPPMSTTTPIRCMFCDNAIQIASEAYILFPTCKHGGIHTRCANDRQTPQQCLKCQLHNFSNGIGDNTSTNNNNNSGTAVGDQKTVPGGGKLCIRMAHTTDAGGVKMIRKRPLQPKMLPGITMESDLRSYMFHKRPTIDQLLKAGITMGKYQQEGGTDSELEKWGYTSKQRQQWAKG